MTFSGSDIGKIKDATVYSFGEEELPELALRYLDVTFDNVIAQGPFNKRVFDFLLYLRRRNIICDFIRAAFTERPSVPEWQEFNKLCNVGPVVAVQQQGDSHPAPDALVAAAREMAPARPSGAVLEGLVKPRLKIMDMERWRAGETSVSAQVCRIDVGATPKGTGFLVGADLVLTNHHVLTSVIAGQEAASNVQCVFDFKRLGDGTVNQGRAVKLAADWLVAKSPPSQAESEDRPDDALPKPDELDFALLRLAEAFGAKPVATAAAGPRNWVKLPGLQPPLPTGAPLIIVQHPNADPISLALDTNAVLGFNANGTRVRYATNTENGSSGSPCFDFDWSIVALHHMGDPNWRNPTFNEGIPIGLIADVIAPFLVEG
ncbi:trypsin-like peptidase domain-containing protein [Rhizobium ruizarguesonis]